MKRADRQALIRGMNVVYIYHDTIDEAGHLDKSIFGACMDAIDEIKNMVRIITNEFGGISLQEMVVPAHRIPLSAQRQQRIPAQQEPIRYKTGASQSSVGKQEDL